MSSTVSKPIYQCFQESKIAIFKNYKKHFQIKKNTMNNSPLSSQNLNKCSSDKIERERERTYCLGTLQTN